MPYIKKEFKTIRGKKIEDFLCENVPLNEKLTLTLLEKGKITDEKNKRLQKNQIIKSEFIYITIFEAMTKGLKPIFDSFHFAIFDKPSGILVHPSSHQIDVYTLLDEIKYHLGEKALLVHRIDAETSGLVLISKNPFSDMILKSMFEEKEYKKSYRAIVQGKIEKKIEINSPISNSSGIIKLKMQVSNDGKDSFTTIIPVSYNEEKNQTLVEAIPHTGRQHQIRVHLDSIGHRIIGDPIYGLDEKLVDKILKKELTQEERIKFSGNNRLQLLAYSLEFEFLDVYYKFNSKQTIS